MATTVVALQINAGTGEAENIAHRDWDPTGDSMEDVLVEGGGTLPYDRAGCPVIYLTAGGTQLCAGCAMDDLRLPPGEDQEVQGYRLLDEPGLVSECAGCGYKFVYEGDDEEAEDGCSGQDRKSYSDPQDRDSYTVKGGWQPHPESGPCSDCGALVEPNDPYYATPCGTYCEACMDQHMEECGICRSEFR